MFFEHFFEINHFLFETFLFVEPNETFFFFGTIGTIDSRAKILSEEDKKTKEVALQDKLDRSNRRYLLRKRCGVEVDMEQARELVGQKLEIYFVSEARWRLGTVRGTFLKFNRSIQVYTWRIWISSTDIRTV